MKMEERKLVADPADDWFDGITWTGRRGSLGNPIAVFDTTLTSSSLMAHGETMRNWVEGGRLTVLRYGQYPYSDWARSCPSPSQNRARINHLNFALNNGHSLSFTHNLANLVWVCHNDVITLICFNGPAALDSFWVNWVLLELGPTCVEYS